MEFVLTLCFQQGQMQEKAGNLKSRLTVVSHEAKKKQHARASSSLRNHYSELFTQMAALKLESVVTQPLSFAY